MNSDSRLVEDIRKAVAQALEARERKDKGRLDEATSELKRLYGELYRRTEQIATGKGITVHELLEDLKKHPHYEMERRLLEEKIGVKKRPPKRRRPKSKFKRV
ncbi:MAG: hypothetical protein A3F09_01495 [Chlamydiae bacterium RIFCSPHIGHO2_12_FULL_49_11]|nr:MAG: hypothetical protein A3F09_01495 [Chlamydiae bacterium RIFCSPHIGHO2_12_FULL_49_11]